MLRLTHLASLKEDRMIETKLQAYQGLSGFLERRDTPQILNLSEYFCVVSKHHYSTTRTDDFRKVVEV